MSAYIPRLEGVDWQEWANRLLSRHYGPTEYQQIPDKYRHGSYAHNKFG